jgi:hypothetical protein
MCAPDFLKMGGHTLVETRFNLYKLDICPSGHSILVNFSPLNIIAHQRGGNCKELSEGVDKL